MARKSFSPEQVVASLRQIGVATVEGKSVPAAYKEACISQQKLRDELLNGEMLEKPGL